MELIPGLFNTSTQTFQKRDRFLFSPPSSATPRAINRSARFREALRGRVTYGYNLGGDGPATS
jgi:hypothetical protein